LRFHYSWRSEPLRDRQSDSIADLGNGQGSIFLQSRLAIFSAMRPEQKDVEEIVGVVVALWWAHSLDVRAPLARSFKELDEKRVQ
jgi:hypothetical protein